MKNTSAGYHTFSFYQKVNSDDYSMLINDFVMYRHKNDDIKDFPIKDKDGKTIGWEYTYKKNKGIRWLLLSSTAVNGFSWQGVAVIINPKALIEGDYIAAAQGDDLAMLERIFNSEAKRISPILWKFGLCSLNRADFCLNIDLKELGIPCSPEMMITLIKQGNIPKGYKERRHYDAKLHRKTTCKSSFYLEGKSMNINYYWKYPQQANEVHPNFLFREASHDVIRLEVQYKYPKLYPLTREYKRESKFFVSMDDLSLEDVYQRLVSREPYNPSIPVDTMLSSKVSDRVNRKHFTQIIGQGDYFTLDGARDIVESYNYRRDKEERMIWTLELIKKYQGIANAKSKLYGPDLDDFKRSIKDLNSIGVNPVTIPRRWNIAHIPNLLRAYDDSIYEEELIPKQEYIVRQHIADFLSGNDG